MVQPTPSRLSPEEFLAWERAQPERHIYVAGEIFAMAGGSPRHNHLCARVIARLQSSLEAGPCRVYTSDQRLGLPEDEFVYADAVVVCGPPSLRPGTSDVITNPCVVVEVLSKSTQAYDRGDKQRGYLSLGSVRHFVLLAQQEVRAEIYTRQSDGSFRFEVLGPAATMQLEGGGVTLALDDLYAGVFELPGD